jgi:hypothetical protein
MTSRNVRFDNLIPLRGRLNHTQLAGWGPPVPAEHGLGCHLLADVMIPLPDGVRLSADVYVPAKSGRYPAIVQFAAYNRELHTTGFPKGTNEIGSPPVITDRGYVQVVVTARGIGRSGGEPMPWHCEPEIDDYVRCIAWAAEQPWSNGDIVMFGTSYYGMNQAAVAARRPPMLRAFFANEICTDFRRHVFRYGGHPNSDFVSLWAGANFTPGEIGRDIPPVLRAALSHVVNRPWAWRLMHPFIDRVMSGFKRREVAEHVLPWYLAMLTDSYGSTTPPLWDGPWRELPQVEVPFVVVQNPGLIALHQFGAYDLFARAGTPITQKRLIVGPPEYELPVLSWQLEALAFFDHVVKKAANGYDRLAPVRYWCNGADAWHSADGFPPSDAVTLRLYPAGGRERMLREGASGGDSITWLSVPRGATVLAGLDKVEPQQLAFGWIAPRDVELFGPVTATLRYQCSEIDSYIVARLDHIDRAGRRKPISMGHLRPAMRRIIDAASSPGEIAINPAAHAPLIPNEPVTLRFSLTPAATRLAQGERLELLIASRTDLLHIPVRDGYVVPDMPVPPYFARNTIRCGAETYLEISMRSA